MVPTFLAPGISFVEDSFSRVRKGSVGAALPTWTGCQPGVALQALVAGCKIDGSNLSCVEAQGGPLRHGTRLSAPLVGPQRDCGENQPGGDLQCPYPQLQGPLASHVSAESLGPLEKSNRLASFPCPLLPDCRGLSSSRVQQGISAHSGRCSKGP